MKGICNFSSFLSQGTGFDTNLYSYMGSRVKACYIDGNCDSEKNFQNLCSMTAQKAHTFVLKLLKVLNPSTMKKTKKIDYTVMDIATTYTEWEDDMDVCSVYVNTDRPYFTV